VLAAAAAVAVVLGAQAVVDDTGPGAGDLEAAFERAADRPGAREVALARPEGGDVARAVLLPDGSGYLRNDGMTALPPGKTYQLWALSEAGGETVAISAGALGSDPRAVAFHTSGPVSGLGLTVEDAPGVVTSSQPMYASAAVT
jgi:hypothetical protein